MSITELRVFVVSCDVPGCGARTRIERTAHPLDKADPSLPPRWTVERVGITEVVRCPAHAAEVSE